MRSDTKSGIVIALALVIFIVLFAGFVAWLLPGDNYDRKGECISYAHKDAFTLYQDDPQLFCPKS